MKTAPHTEPIASRSAPFFGKAGNSGAFIQPRRTVGPAHDAFEQEADRVADAAVRGGGFVQPKLRVNPVLQRKCAQCEEEEKLQRKGTGDVATAPPAVETALAQPGRTLDAPTRTWAERAMGHDFSSVKIHHDAEAAHSAASIGARAYTSGSNVVFGAGEFSPNTESGRHLLAHELTHVVQQGGSGGLVQRQSVYDETPGPVSRGESTISNADGSNSRTEVTYSGHVDRAEYRTEADRQAQTNAIHSARVPVRYEETACRLVVPIRLRFVNQTDAFRTSCGNISGVRNDPVTPVSQAVFDRTRQQFLTEVPRAINDTYKVVLGGTCAPCREVPVVAEFTEVTTGADRTVVVTGNRGRSYVSGDGSTVAVCGGSGGESTSTLIHEGGHFALGWGDEYHESEGSRPTERERLGEYSRMAQDAPARLLEWHDRHFAFAAAFLRSVYPACAPTLVRTRTPAVEIELTFAETGLLPERGSGDLALSVGLQFGFPLLPMRRLSLMVGPNFTYLTTNQDFMAGFRMGLQGQIPVGNLGPLGTFGLGARAFGEAGTRFDFSGASPDVVPYLEGGGGVDLRFFDNLFRLGVEAARGVMDPGGIGSDSYTRVGGAAAFSF